MDKEKQVELLRKIQHVIAWVAALDCGEFITTRFSSRTHMTFEESTSSDDLDLICKSVNVLLEQLGHNRRVVWNATEIVPYLVNA